MKKFETYFNHLPTSLMYSYDDPDDPISALNQLINNCIFQHATTRRDKFTILPAPWMNDSKIISLKNNLEYLQGISNDVKDILRDTCRTTKVSYKKDIKKTKADVINKALSSKNRKKL